ncbi:MAG: tetratricopeptide repeat protein [Janthinobacterium lividum]
MRKAWSIPLVLLVTGATATVAIGAASDDTVSPASLRWVAIGQAALDKNQPSAAIDAFEAALAVDPKDARAFLGIAHAYDMQGLPGRAIKNYREALALEPNDLGALEGQGKALIARGATTRARVNLERIKTLCKTDCSAAKRLETALAAPPPVIAATASAEPIKPVVGKN